jgi:hypothetical protein
VFGSNGNGVLYTANVEIETDVFTVRWWQIAVGVFVVLTIFIWCIKFSKKGGKTTVNKSSAKRAYTKARTASGNMQSYIKNR